MSVQIRLAGLNSKVQGGEVAVRVEDEEKGFKGDSVSCELKAT